MAKTSQRSKVFYSLIPLLLSACSGDQLKTRYLLADRLWSEEKFDAAVTEFEKIYSKDQKGQSLGYLALYRAAEIQFQQGKTEGSRLEVLSKINKLLESVKPSSDFNERLRKDLFLLKIKVLNSQLQDKSRQEAIKSLEKIFSNMNWGDLSPEENNIFLLLKASFQKEQNQYQKAIETLKEAYKKNPNERTSYEICSTYFLIAQQSSQKINKTQIELYQGVVDRIEEHLKNYPQGDYTWEAQFLLASCEEEMEQYDIAYQRYQSLLVNAKNSNVIIIKLYKLNERKKQRKS
jgi:tetratricopeptide (TPR) repeat protein